MPYRAQPGRILILALATLAAGALSGEAQTGAPQLVFRAGVDLVTVTAVVRDGDGRLVRGLTADDFVVRDNGERRPIAGFAAGHDGPVSVGIVFDASGSMRLAGKANAAREAAERLLDALDAARDEVALFGFDRELVEIEPFTADVGAIRARLGEIEPFGETALYDAVAEAARRVAARRATRSAVLVLTDGIDTSSRLSPEDVSGIANAIAVPVYIVAAVSPLDDPASDASIVEPPPAARGRLEDLARWTGGRLEIVSSAAAARSAAEGVLGELRHQYVLSLEAADEPGWHVLDVRTRDDDLAVRVRGGYMARGNAGTTQQEE